MTEDNTMDVSLNVESSINRDSFTFDSRDKPDACFAGFNIKAVSVSFSLANKIGHGAWSKVLSGVLLDGRRAAIKKVRTDSYREGLYSVEKEARNLLKLSENKHGNMITYHGGFLDKDHTFFVFEQADFQLEYFLQEKTNSLTVGQYNNIVFQTLEMLSYLSSIGMRHRDFLFLNMVYFLSSDQIKLIDFGNSTLDGDTDHKEPLEDLKKLGEQLIRLQIDMKFKSKFTNDLVKIRSDFLTGSKPNDYLVKSDQHWFDHMPVMTREIVTTAFSPQFPHSRKDVIDCRGRLVCETLSTLCST